MILPELLERRSVRTPRAVCLVVQTPALSPQTRTWRADWTFGDHGIDHCYDGSRMRRAFLARA